MFWLFGLICAAAAGSEDSTYTDWRSFRSGSFFPLMASAVEKVKQQLILRNQTMSDHHRPGINVCVDFLCILLDHTHAVTPDTQWTLTVWQLGRGRRVDRVLGR